MLLAALFALTAEGPGSYSVDGRLFPRFRGPALAVAQVAVGYAGSWLATSELVNGLADVTEAGRSGRRPGARAGPVAA